MWFNSSYTPPLIKKNIPLYDKEHYKRQNNRNNYYVPLYLYLEL